MCSGHGRLCVCLSVVSVPRRIPTLLHGLGSVGGMVEGSLWLCTIGRADLQSVLGFRCYDNIAPNAE